jgi:Uma2 family endonuclease
MVTSVPLLLLRRAEHNMGMPNAAPVWTPDRVRALPDDGRRYEVVAGELLVTPAPSFDHQEAALRLAELIRVYLESARVGHATMSPADLQLEADSLVQPDVFVAPLIDGRRPKSWTEIDRLLLAVEVLSPSTARADRTVKRLLFQRTGVPEYWIVDLDARLVERWRPGDARPEVLTDVVRWQPDPGFEPLAIDLTSFFADVLGAP